METTPSYFIKTRFYHMGFSEKFEKAMNDFEKAADEAVDRLTTSGGVCLDQSLFTLWDCEVYPVIVRISPPVIRCYPFCAVFPFLYHDTHSIRVRQNWAHFSYHTAIISRKSTMCKCNYKQK